MSALDKFRVEGDAGPTDRWADIKPLATSFVGGVLCWDQSLGDTGMVNLYVTAPDRILIRAATLITTVPDDNETIAADSYRRAMELEERVESLMEHHEASEHVVMELPPTGGRNLKGVTSPFLAGYVIYRAAKRWGKQIHIVQSQAAKKRWTGSAGATKKLVREALVAKFPGVASMKPLNEHTTDAVLLGLTQIEKLK